MTTKGDKNYSSFSFEDNDYFVFGSETKGLPEWLLKKYLNTKVLWSSETPLIKGSLGTFCAIPMTAGAIIAQYVINDLLK